MCYCFFGISLWDFYILWQLANRALKLSVTKTFQRNGNTNYLKCYVVKTLTLNSSWPSHFIVHRLKSGKEVQFLEVSLFASEAKINRFLLFFLSNGVAEYAETGVIKIFQKTLILAKQCSYSCKYRCCYTTFPFLEHWVNFPNLAHSFYAQGPR